MHTVGSELVEELLAARDGGASSAASTLLVIRPLFDDTLASNALRVDADGDLELPRRTRKRRRIGDNHAAATSVTRDDDAAIVLETLAEGGADATGVQLWRASFLLAEYLQSRAHDVRDSVMLELGCGVGFVAIAVARLARRVLATDGDDAALAVCTRNVARNACARDRVRVQRLEWGSHAIEAKAELDGLFSCDENEADVQPRIDWIVASDVFYDDVVADAFLDTLHRLMLEHPTAKVVVAAERRVVFSAFTLSEISLGYDAFQRRLCHHATATAIDACSCLSCCQKCATKGSSAGRFVASLIPVASIPRVFAYERVSTLAVWRLHAVVAPA